jgi:hypothetical protein
VYEAKALMTIHLLEPEDWTLGRDLDLDIILFAVSDENKVESNKGRVLISRDSPDISRLNGYEDLEEKRRNENNLST